MSPSNDPIPSKVSGSVPIVSHLPEIVREWGRGGSEGKEGAREGVSEGVSEGNKSGRVGLRAGVEELQWGAGAVRERWCERWC